MGVLRKIAGVLFDIPTFRSRIKMLKGGPGIATEQLDCGCFLKAEHIPEKNMWVFTYDYSKCRMMHMKRNFDVNQKTN